MKTVSRWFLTIIGLTFIVVVWINLLKKPSFESIFINQKSVALITAHPDDEVVFFSPTILQLQKNGVLFYLICVTFGDYEGHGADRMEELYNCCNELGVNTERIIFINNKNFLEHPSKRWENLSSLVENLNVVLKKLEIETVFTFGPYGCSGHPNHIDTHTAVRSLKTFRRFFLKDSSLNWFQSAFLEILSTSFTNSKSRDIKTQ
ncbi:N-acetylglucosaminyl-phosphatidylinositol de-N-acetylase-like [Hydra vulgaris]|uniref:N-acetylglucosaminylphosphatidylinositol deacetylase n=1 Tax=Hydra vulgaris TaxID=6087 RepID=A0ABM4DC48_HYDVU